MNVRLMHVESMARSGTDRRREPRFATRVEARLQTSDGHKASVLLAEVSLHGCRIVIDEPWLRNGMFVSIGLADEPMLEAIVRWVRDGGAGMEFLWPIPPERSEWQELANMGF